MERAVARANELESLVHGEVSALERAYSENELRIRGLIEELAAQREKARIGMANGDERYLPVRDKGPQRKFARDFVDAGWHAGELLMPLMLVVILVSLVQNQAIVYYSFVALWVFILFVVGDMIITSHRVKKLAREKFGDRTEKGLGWYAAMRTIQMRFMRLPKAQVKRGQYPE